MKANVDNDLLMLYHKDGQQKKAVIPIRDLIVAANYFSGGVAGSYSAVVKKYSKNLPDGIVVYGDNTGRRFKFTGGRVTDPDTDTYNSVGVSNSWVDLDSLLLLPLVEVIKDLELRIQSLEDSK